MIFVVSSPLKDSENPCISKFRNVQGLLPGLCPHGLPGIGCHGAPCGQTGHISFAIHALKSWDSNIGLFSFFLTLKYKSGTYLGLNGPPCIKKYTHIDAFFLPTRLHSLNPLIAGPCSLGRYTLGQAFLWAYLVNYSKYGGHMKETQLKPDLVS